MRRVACYSATSALEAGESASEALQLLVEGVADWLRAKGLAELPSDRSVKFHMKDGREATASAANAVIHDDSAWDFTVEEPTDSGNFLTRLCLGARAHRLYLFLELRAGADGARLAPVAVDVRCPQVLRSLLNRRLWYTGAAPVLTKPMKWHGADAAAKFMAVVRHPERNLPIVAASQRFGQPLVSSLAEDLSRDLSGLAIVADLDEAASWAITNAEGKEWSCYNGAVRVYWPIRGTSGSAFDHPLWRSERLLEVAGSEIAAASRLRNQLRRRLLELSTYTFDEPIELIQLREEAARAQFEAMRADAAAKGDQAELAEHYFNESVRLEKRNSDLQEMIDRLQGQVNGLLQALRHQSSTTEDEIAPEPERRVSTVAEAVERARTEFSEDLVFGTDVEKGIEGLAADAGPPDKIYEHFRTLAEMTRARKEAGLGKDMLLWLRERGLKASNESETTLNSGSEMQRRTWVDGTGRKRRFEKHLKPSEGTSPDRCVRIYFDYEEALGMTVIGWVGRHP